MPGYRLDRADVVPRRQHPQGGHVLAEQRGLALGERRPVLAVARGPLQQRVVDVGDVLDVVDLPLGVEPHALHEVERVVGRRVPHVGGVVRRDAADVDTGDGTGVEGDRSAGRGVVDPEVAALAGQGGDLGSGPGMHAMSVTGRSVPDTTRTGPLAGSALLRSAGRRPAGRAVTPAARGSRASSPLGSGWRPVAQQRADPVAQRPRSPRR